MVMLPTDVLCKLVKNPYMFDICWTINKRLLFLLCLLLGISKELLEDNCNFTYSYFIQFCDVLYVSLRHSLLHTYINHYFVLNVQVISVLVSIAVYYALDLMIYICIHVHAIILSYGINEPRLHCTLQ